MRELATCLNVVKRVKFYILYFKNCNIVYWEKKRVEKEGKKMIDERRILIHRLRHKSLTKSKKKKIKLVSLKWEDTSFD